MKHKQIHKYGSLRKQILVFTMSMVLICLILTGSVFFVISRSVVRKNLIDSTLKFIEHTAYTVEQDLNGIQELMDYFFVDKQIQSALSEEIITDYDRILQWNQLNDALSTYKRFDYFQYINCILFYNAEGNLHTFSYMAPDTKDYVVRNEELGWYQEALEGKGRLLWGSDVTSLKSAYSSYTAGIGTADVSAMRALRNQSYKRVRGVVYISIKPEYFSVMKKNNGLSGMDVYLFDNAGRLLNPKASEEEVEECLSCLNGTKWQDTGYRYCAAGQNIIYDYSITSCGYRLVAVQPLQDTFWMDNSIMVLGGVILVVMLLISVSLWIFLNRKVIRPVNILSDTMKRVHTEGLSVRVSGVGSSEFEYLSDNLNYMLNQIQDLMERNLEKERAVQEAEHKAVLAQINPHFVYNALFAIRMMAMMQKAENIRDMVDALWRMLKNSTSRAKEIFTLADEIQNIRDYIHILSATNVQKFEVIYEIETELYEAFCPAFLIQPVVENAIMHGILPKQGFSTIRICAVSREETVVITIINDGIPIPEKQLEEVKQTLSKAAAHKGLGLSSICQRLKLLYGEAAGLTITSGGEMERTVVTIHYPVQKGTKDV